MSDLDRLQALAPDDGCPHSPAYRREWRIAWLQMLRRLTPRQRRLLARKGGAR